MSLYDDFYPVAVELLEEFGAAATLKRIAPPVPTTADKRAGRIARPLPQTVPVRAVVGPQAIQGADGRLVRSTVATMLVEPREGDTLTMGASSWTVGAVTRIAPQGQPIVYTAEVS